MSVETVVKPGKLDSLQWARALAAVSVCLFHAAERTGKSVSAPEFSRFFESGKLGVDLFFVISGFIIFFVHFKDINNQGASKRYLYRRFTRIYPLYWAIFIPITILYLMTPGAGDGSERDVLSIVRCFFLLPNPDGQIIGVAWTLVFELSFYMAFLSLILSRKLGIILISLWVSLIFVRQLNLVNFGYFNAYLSVRYFEFACGAAVYFLFSKFQPKFPGLLALSGVISLYGGGLFLLSHFPESDRAIILFSGLSAAVAVFGFVSLDFAGEARGVIGLIAAKLGDASYAIYLFHWIIGWVLGAVLLKLPFSFPAVLFFIILALPMIVGGYVMHLVLEKPLLRWMRKLEKSQGHAERWRAKVIA